MKRNLFNYFIYCTAACLFISCSSGNSDSPSGLPDTPPVDQPMPITLSLGIAPESRATENEFEANDCIGLYVVNYQGQTAGQLADSGNHVDNMRFTYNGTWTPQSPIYWKDNTTPADFYVYYPYGDSQEVTAYSYSVKSDQSTLNNYKISDFMWGKATKVMPTEDAIRIQANHLFSTVRIKIAAGNGFTEESLNTAKIKVTLNGCKTEAQINLNNGVVQASGTPTAILPYLENKIYKALVVPQNVSAENFITVNVNERDYNLKKSFTFESGHRYTFTVTVSKTSNGINVGINPWEDDTTDHGGTAE